ncbi:MFS transporter [Pyxidicoccus parkwayensis]|uniref:MFS transporter n=1 Tax=Pyxidicoccus parkwayensis TaxID=2813578 RepID=A0ABX7NPI0_9BACT|nr:MFS transporter [Pyxidicoccus parkwaysis]QSQ20760.1 MFS transporter [Pyxidicoccus parkwaysis]
MSEQAGTLGEERGAQRALWSDAGWRRWVVAASVVRLSGTMAAFALLLAGEAATGSYASGAWMASAYAFGSAAAAPFRGRAMDRRLLPDGMRVPLLLTSALCLALAGCCVARAPLPLLLGLSLALGVVPAGVFGAYRALMPSLLPPRLLEPAFSIDAVLIEVQWMMGPPLVGALALAHPALALVTLAVCNGTGAFLNRRLPQRAPPPSSTAPGERVSLAPFRTGLPALVYLGVVSNGLSWGLVDAAIPPRLEQVGARAEAWGLMAALLSATSAVGGLLAAQSRTPGTDAAALRRGLLFLAAWGAMLIPTGLMASSWGIALWLAAGGFFLAPQSALYISLLQRRLPVDRHAEGFALFNAGWALGIGAGSAAAAVLLDTAGSQVAMLLSGVAPILVALGARLSRHAR